MTNSKIGTVEAIMLVLTIVVAHTMSSMPRDILVSTGSSSLLNLIFVSIIAIFLAYLIYRLLKKFPRIRHCRYI